MEIVRNIWYVAAWADEVKDKPLGRKLLNELVLIYRKQDQEAVALSGLCPHRFAPLHMGKIQGDSIQCPYHGLEFGPNGACTLNPHGDGVTPKAAKVRSYPLVERYNLLWIWMGEEELADPESIPDFDFIVDPRRKAVPGHTQVNANYQVITDNLLDLSHSMFLHANFHFNADRLKTPQEVFQEGNSVFSHRWMPNTKGPKSRMRAYSDPNMPVDYWLRMRWDPPGVARLETGVTPTGHAESEGTDYIGAHLLTPETETSTHYFYAGTRNYLLDNEEEDNAIREWQRIGFGQQDKPMVEAIQSEIGNHNIMDLNPVLLPIDTAAVRARRVVEKLIAKEAPDKETK